MKEHTKKSISNSWKILWKYLSGYRREFIILSVLGVFSALANGSVPYIAGKFFDAILAQDIAFPYTDVAMPLWAFLLAVWTAVQGVAIVTDWWNSRIADRISNQAYADYVSRSFGYILRLPLSYYKKSKQGGTHQAVSRAANAIESISGRIIIDLAPKFLSIFIGIVFAFSMNAILAWVLIAGVVIYASILVFILPNAKMLQRRMHGAFMAGWNESYEAYSHFASVKQSSTEGLHARNITEKFARAMIVSNLLNFLWGNINFFQRVIVVGSQLVIFILSVFAIRAGTMTIGELLAFNGYAALVFGPFVTLGTNWQTLQNGLVDLERAERILSEKPELYSPPGAVKNFDFKGSIVFDRVSFGYKKGQEVLRDISFSAKPGEVVALVGESGAGKSTLIDLISGYYVPQAGKVLVDGHSTKKLDLKFLRKHIAVVPQEVALFHDTVKKNIAYGSPRATDEEVMSASRVAHADLFIETFPKKYAQVVGERGIKLSVGQKQRIAIARAVLRDPRILILDEPTSALDSETEKFVTDALGHIMKGRTTFIIAHRLSTVRRADKILVLEKGEIVESGTHEELMQIEGGNYRRRYELHIGLV